MRNDIRYIYFQNDNNVTCCMLQEKIRKRIFFHGTDRESLIAHLDKTLLFKKYGGELDPIDESYGTNLWHYMCKHENMYKSNHLS